jgi:hypothetical protein
MAYDSDRGVTVFFGGEIGKTGIETYFNDTWEYDGSHWRQITIVGDIPPARSLHSMAYDPVRKRVLMYGGFAGGVYGLDDTWEYQGNGFSGTWTHVAGNASDEGFVGPGLVWASFFGAILRVGGIDRPYYTPSGVFTVPGPPYSWMGSWVADRNPAGPQVWGFGLTYDSFRNVGVLVGGYDRSFDTSGLQTPNDVWEFLFNIGWTNTASNFPGRGFPTMAYDDRRHKLFVVGGDNGQAGTGEQAYEFDSQHPENGWKLGVSLPSGMGRAGVAMVYDSKRGVMVLMGGAGPGAPNSNDGGRYDDTWELVPTPPQLSLTGPAATDILCSLQPFTLQLNSIGLLPLFTYEWRVDGIPFVEQTNGTFQIPGPEAGVHTFLVVATDQCGNPAATNVSYIFHSAPHLNGIIVQNALASDGVPVPTNYYACPGSSVSISADILVDAYSLPTTFQWFFKGAPLPGETNNTLSLSNLRHEQTGHYSVIASDACGSLDTSLYSPVYLQVGVTIDTQPVDTIGQVCHSAEFLVQARGFGTLDYQWRMDGIPLGPDPHFSGIDTSNLVISPVLYAHERDYDVVITDNCGAANAVTSHVAQLTVQPGPQWVLRTTNGPTARWGNAMAYDSARGVTVMYGGGQSVPNVGYVGFGELWEWNGAHWTQRTTYTNSAAWKRDANGYWAPSYGIPAGRLQHAMAYDSRRGRTVVFGGRSATPEGGDYSFQDTWEWDGSQWWFRGTNGPPAQFAVHMAYDPGRGVTVVYGGSGASTAEVWEWNGTNWHSRPITNELFTSFLQTSLSMDFDGSLGQVFFGPVTDGPTLWFLSWGSNGSHDLGNGFAIVDPDPVLASMVFDDYRKRSILFGGQNGGFDNFYGGSTTAFYTPRRDWSKLPDALQTSLLILDDLLAPAPLALKLSAQADPVSQFIWTNFSSADQSAITNSISNPGLLLSTLVPALNGIIQGNSIYDPTRFAGVALSTETALFKSIGPVANDLARFNRLLLEDAYPLAIRRSPSTPTGRYQHAMAFDSARHATVLQGGRYLADPVGNDTWELLDVDTPLINEQPASQYRLSGDTAVFNVAAVGPTGTSLKYDWFFGAVPLTDGGRFSGAHSPTLTIANVTAADAGQYQARISNDCATIYSSPAVLTTDPRLQIFSSVNSITLVWASSSAVLQEADSLVGPWTPVPGATSPFDVAAQGVGKFFRLAPTGP